MFFVLTKKRRLLKMFNWAMREADNSDSPETKQFYLKFAIHINEAISFLAQLEKK